MPWFLPYGKHCFYVCCHFDILLVFIFSQYVSLPASSQVVADDADDAYKGRQQADYMPQHGKVPVFSCVFPFLTFIVHARIVVMVYPASCSL